ncbi:MAG: HlyC/CorC family transporter [bacterium]|nr:HlyC/CorC family transporter [bacterium]MCP4964045.1 HlyC/CorC family transporter [bacterium]
MDWNRDRSFIALFVVLFLIAVVLAAAETALVRVSRVRIAALAEDGSHRAARTLGLLDDLPYVLNTILLVVLLVQIGAATITGILAERWFGSVGVTVATFALTVFLFVYSEAIPKTYAYRNAASVVMTLAYPVGLLTSLLRPIVSVLVKFADLHAPGRGIATAPTVTERELRSLAAAAATEGEITDADLSLIEGAFRLGDRVAEEVMVPRVDMVAVSAGAATQEALQLAIRTGHRRLPVQDGGIDNIIGVVRQRDLVLSPDLGVADLAYPPLLVAESKRVLELLREMQEGGIHVAIVIDEHGGTSGMVTIEDIVEELFGVVSEEGAVATSLLRRIGEGRWLVDGGLLTADLEVTLGCDLPEGDWTTVGGMVMGLAGELPKVDSEWNAGCASFRVTSVVGRRIRRVEVILASPK